MNGKIVGIAVALIIVLGAAWWMRSGGSGGATAAGPDRSKVARSEPSPAPAHAPKSEADGQAAMPALQAAPASQAPEKKRDGDNAYIDRLFMPPRPDASEAERLAWDQSPVSQYVYPTGHPCEGLPRDNASVEALVQAAARPQFFEQFPEADRPQILLEGRKDFFPLNNLCAKSLNREDPASVEQFIQCFNSLPENPTAYPAVVWLPVAADHPGATTMRAHMTELIRASAQRLMARPRCSG